jgi:Cof subfamily protein (haloacid dehalogenase superfamily)
MPFSGIAVSSSVPRNVEINREDATKGRALLALAKHLGLRREQVMAFGDGLNDIAMIENAGVGVAMGNAVDEVRRVADKITATNDEDGVAAVIETLL